MNVTPGLRLTANIIPKMVVVKVALGYPQQIVIQIDHHNTKH